MIGFYDYTVVLTYISLACSIIGITQSINGFYTNAIICLALSGLFDMFDGKIARSKKDRTDDEKIFGVQIDSLCDLVCFGLFPAIICFTVVGCSIISILIMVFYCICSVIRLAYFNVLETKRQQVEGGANKHYHGLPITTISIVLPLVFLLKIVLSNTLFVIVLLITMFAVGFLFIIDIHIKKPTNAQLCMLVMFTGCIVIAFLLCSHFHLINIPKERNLLSLLSKVGGRNR